MMTGCDPGSHLSVEKEALGHSAGRSPSRKWPVRSGPTSLPDRQHYIEPRPQRIVRGGDLHDEFAVKEFVGEIRLFVGEIELGGQHRSFRRLDLYVIVPRAAGIEAGHDGTEGVTPLGVGKDVAAQAETLVVVFAIVVGLP